jgi:phosphoribosylanthranilate isomerase
MVGVFVNARLGEVLETMGACGLDAVQLHGDEDEEAIHALGPRRVIRAVRLAGLDQIGLVARSAASLVLVEPLVEGVRGGSGQRLDEGLARAAIATGRPIMLAGGLSPENVHDAVVRLRPYAVDVGSGVEAAPGRKDHGKIRDFVAAVREADRAVGIA